MGNGKSEAGNGESGMTTEGLQPPLQPIPHSRFPTYHSLVSFSRAASYYYAYYATLTGRGVRRARM
jgi:hypothetical protein